MAYRFIIVLVGLLLFTACSTHRSSPTENIKARKFVTTPPFSTLEPLRYQAVRTITSIDSATSDQRVTRSRIARSGPNRREEYERATGDVLVYLEVPAGRFVLLPSAKLMADLSEVSPNPPSTAATSSPDSDLSADRLLHQTVLETHYDLLGRETLSGRSTAKYRVAPLLDSGANQSDAETLIWIDEALQIPVRWETSSKSADRQTKTVMELSEISLEVDDRIFALPVDYKKVNSQALGLGNGNLTAAEATKGKN